MSFVFNIAKGKVAYYATLVGTGGARLLVVPIEASGLEAEATLKDYTNLSALLAGSSNEQTSNMTRKAVTSAIATADNSGDKMNADCADVTWTAATGNAVGALVICFDPTGSSADTALIPLTKHDWAVTPDGTDLTATISNFFQAGD